MTGGTNASAVHRAHGRQAASSKSNGMSKHAQPPRTTMQVRAEWERRDDGGKRPIISEIMGQRPCS
jgi:hypothetical protein